jgi:peptidoglycan/LPS O-acetylase OafA/YrhL
MSIPTYSPKTRLDWIDQTKGLAILGIVLFHFFQNYPDRTSLVSLLDRSGAKIGLAAVDLFFVIAGFNISYILAAIATKQDSKQVFINWKDWLLKRLNRLYPTYILAVSCSLLLYEIFDRSVQYFSFEFLLSFVGLGGYLLQAINPGFWFFTVILQAYLFVPILYQASRGNYQKILIFGILSGVLTKIICIILEPGSSAYLYFLNNNFLGSYIFQFCLGLYWGAVYHDHGALRKCDCIASGICFAIGAIAYTGVAIAKIDIIYMQGFDIAFTPLLFVFCWLGFEKVRNFKAIAKSLGTLSILGIYSYQIYLIHQPLLFVTLPKFTKFMNTIPTLEVGISVLITVTIFIFYTKNFIALDKLLRKFYFSKP